MRIFLDANVLFSAAKSNGSLRRLLALLGRARHDFVVDAFAVEEARRNLALKGEAGLAALDRLVTKLEVAGMRAHDPALLARLPLPEKDQPVLAAAIALGCQALVTDDRTHFGGLYGHTVEGVTIHSPRSLAEALLG